ncbi:hypothetical protein ACOSP6_01480 [Tenacibaculum sp. MEBiC06402]|uniref:hypothetical protein n=1 Tax=Tenacibaculum sp. MEBiC06402 TaxID=3412023 RepID=UPI003B9D3E17
MKKIFNILIILIIFGSCTEDERDLSFVDSIVAPANVAATYDITQDNTGSVTITPTADGASNFKVFFGDTTAEPAELAAGESVEHVYAEGTYELKVQAFSLNGKMTETTQQLVVSFKAPENLLVTIENDQSVSRQVNVTATADFATMFEFYSGEPGVSQPVATANIGETLNYQYAMAGDYDMRVVAKGAAIATTEYTATFTVTEILQPVDSAPIPPTRNDTDVISIYSAAYTNVAGTDTFPDWGQGGQGSSWAEFDLNGDKMLQYVNLSYQGIQFGSSQDVSGMEYLHLDVWTTDVDQLETSLINISGGVTTEAPVTNGLTSDQWTSIDIPISDYTDQGLTVTEILQLKFVGTPWAAGTVFIDNIYFWKSPSNTSTLGVQDFEGAAPTFTSFGGAGVEVIANPDMSGANTTANVARLTKGNGSEIWAGGFFEIASPLDLANYSKISVKTWSPKQGAVVKLKLENQDASITHEVDLNTTVANQWEQLVYDFSGAPTADYVRIVIFFDFGNNGDDSQYYYDEIELVNDAGGPQPLVFQDFEGTAPAFTVFGNIAGIDVIANPDATGANTTANVARLTKTNGSEIWAGAFFETGSPLDFNTYSKISVKTWSPKQGAVVKVKLENQDASVTHEIDVNTTVANQWEELVYDFSGAPTADYVRVVIFFDFGNNGDDSVYYFDQYTLTN